MIKFSEWVLLKEEDGSVTPLAQVSPTEINPAISRLSIPVMLKKRLLQVIDEMSKIKEGGQQVSRQKIITMLSQMTQEMMANTALDVSGAKRAGSMAFKNSKR